MKKIFWIGLPALFIGIAIGVLGTIVAYPFIFPPAEVNETLSDIEHKRKLFSAMFIHPNPSDTVHWGKGGVAIYEQDNRVEIFLQEDFEVGPGPNYWVYLSNDAGIVTRQAFRDATTFEIAKLKSFSGSQVYRVPESVDFSGLKSVAVWCKTFGQLITSADLRAVDMEGKTDRESRP